MTAQSVVIARFSQVKMTITMALLLAAIAAVYSHYWGEPSEHWFIIRPYDHGLLIWKSHKWLAWTAATLLLLLSLYGMRQWLRYGGAAVSIENGVVQGYFGTAPLHEIKDVSLGRRKLGVHQTVIILTLRNGEELTVPLWTLTEPGPVILARLQNVLKDQRSA